MGEGLIGALGRRLQAFINATIERTARPLVKWLLHLEIAYLLAAGFAVIAAAFLLSAASSGLVEAGLPVWAAQLILGVVAAGVAFVMFKRAAAKKFGDEISDGESSAPKGLTIRIGRTRTVRAATRRPTATYDVHPSNRADGWEVTSGAPPARETFRTKRKAVSAARRRAAGASGGHVVVHKADGTIQRSRRSRSA